MLIVFDLSRFRFHFSLSVACNFFKEKKNKKMRPTKIVLTLHYF